jgi:general secretion pathway protein K
MTRNNFQKGGALLAVLWMSAALAAIAFSVSTSVRAETERVGAASEGLRAWYLATGSVDRAVQWMLWGPGPRNPDGSVRFWEPTKPRLYMSYPGGDVVVEMIPESSKLNLNFAAGEDLTRLITVIGGNPELAREIAAAILDWRGPAFAQGAQGPFAISGSSPFDAYYLSLGPTFRPRHASFQEIEELLLVRGMTPELFYGTYVADAEGRLYPRGGLRDCLSPWGSTAGPFDVNTASPALLEAVVGLPLPAIEAVVRRRTAQPFRNLKEVADLGIPMARLGLGGRTTWTLRATARLRRPDGTPSDVVRSAAAVVKVIAPTRQRPTLQIPVLRFYEDAWSEFAVAP